jgi:hypothetical protein
MNKAGIHKIVLHGHFFRLITNVNLRNGSEDFLHNLKPQTVESL